MKKTFFILSFLFLGFQLWCGEFIYEQITENNCIITLFSESINENGENVSTERYRIEIINNLYQTKIETGWLPSRPPPRLYWENNNLFRINLGSGLAPSIYSYFYSRELHILSREYNLATGVIDKNNNLILCAEFEFTIYNIFFPEKNIVLNTPDDSGGGILWFRIAQNTHFENKMLFLEYHDENWDLKSKIYNLEETNLYYR